MNGALLFFPALAILVWLTIFSNKLTVAAGLTGGFIATALYLGTGYLSVLLPGVFFVMGTIATSWKFSRKAEQGYAEKNMGKRDMFQVIANAGVAGILGIIAWIYPQYEELLLLMIAASMSAATADTLSSELGTIYGSGFFNIITFKPDTRGENGVVSIAGLLIGVAGSFAIGLVYSIITSFNWRYLCIILIAGTLGNIIDSLTGATLERSGKLKNNSVNFINTLAAALIGWILFF